MTVQNTGKKVIGFGPLVLTPDAVGTLPKGYGPDHPVVQFYLGKKWLKEVKGGKAATPKADPALELTDEEKAAAAKAAELAAKLKAIGRLNLEPLRVEATNLGVAWAEGDTKAEIVQKITEFLQAEYARG